MAFLLEIIPRCTLRLRSFLIIGHQAGRFLCHEVGQYGCVWGLPQLIGVHQQQILGNTGDFEFSVEKLAPYDIYTSVNHRLSSPEPWPLRNVLEIKVLPQRQFGSDEIPKATKEHAY